MIDQEAAAFPATYSMGGTKLDSKGGLTIRAYFAGQMMAAIVQGTAFGGGPEKPWEQPGFNHQSWCASAACGYADALIARLNSAKGGGDA